MERFIESLSENLPTNIVLLQCGEERKHPISKGWQNRTDSDPYNPSCNYAMLTGKVSGIWVFDIDNKEDNIDRVFQWFEDNNFDPTTDAFTVGTPSGGYHIYFRYKDYMANVNDSYMTYNDIQCNGKCVIFIDSKYTKGYIIKNGKNVEYPYTEPYTLINDVPITEAPQFIINAVVKSYNSSEDDDEDDISPESSSICNESNTSERIIEYLGLLKKKRCNQYSDWVKIGMILKNELGNSGLHIFDQFSSSSEKYDGYDSLKEKWDTFKTNSELKLGTLIHMAKEDRPLYFEKQRQQEAKRLLKIEREEAKRLLKMTAEEQRKYKEQQKTLREQEREEHKKEIESYKVFAQTAFEKQVEEFEKTHCKIISDGVYIRYKDNKIDILNQKRLMDTYCHIPSSLDPSKQFINQWIKYPNITTYDYMDIYPDKHNCPPNCFNLWTEFECDTIEQYKEMTEERDLILNHIKILCNHNTELYNYFINWIAHMLQYPDQKSTMITFYGKQGSGKGCLLTLLKNIVGKDKYFSTAKPNRDVWGSFNSLMQTSCLVNLDEMDKKMAFEADNEIKNLITEATITINKKGVNQYSIKSNHRFIITTNNIETIKITDDDRRNVLIESSRELIGNFRYFDNMWKLVINKDVIKTMAEYFKSLPVQKIYLNVYRPMSEIKQNSIDVSKSRYQMWLENYASTKTGIVEEYSNACYSSFKSFCDYNNMAINEINSVKFGIYLSKLDGVMKKRSNGSLKYIFDTDLIKKGCGMIDNDDEVCYCSSSVSEN